VEAYKKALEKKQPFDTVFMDISMPVMDGFEAIREIRQLENEMKASPCRIAALTGLSSELSRKEALSSGSDLFLTKPVKMDTVKKLLDEKLEKV
jgi:CheY-like chemotaxis protein